MKNLKPGLTEKLWEYQGSDFYPFHMPGHKRQMREELTSGFPNPFLIDITEIDGFDNLHHPEGILKESMEWASGVYGSDQTYYLVNGSSCGVLSAICGTVPEGGTLLMSRNCHKSAYHGVFLKRLKTKYVYPQTIPGFGLQGGLNPLEINEMLTNHPEIQAVLVVSPTYDGIVSDIEGIAGAVHRHQIPLIVDEAHGAHFPYGREGQFPVSALELGADVVIQSLHKTLPSFTQTAVLHIREGYVSAADIERYLQIFQSSSPSYVLMAGIENCIRWMDKEGRLEMKNFGIRLKALRTKLSGLKYLKLFTEEQKGSFQVYDVDLSKIIISTRGTVLSGAMLAQWLRREYHLEMEMCGVDYVTAITTLMDTEEGLERLCSALLEIDGRLEKEGLKKENTLFGYNLRGQVALQRQIDLKEEVDLREEIDLREQAVLQEEMDLREQAVLREEMDLQGQAVLQEEMDLQGQAVLQGAEARLTISQALNGKRHEVLLTDASGKISGEFIYLYPPGIPIVAPGEVLRKEMVDLILEYKNLGLSVQGAEDGNVEWIKIVDDLE